jgi:hypothetical protein
MSSAEVALPSAMEASSIAPAAITQLVLAMGALRHEAAHEHVIHRPAGWPPASAGRRAQVGAACANRPAR